MKVCRLCRRYAVGVAQECSHDGGALLEGPVPPFVPGDEVGSYEVQRAFAAGDTGVLLSAEPSGADEADHPVLIKVLSPARGAVDARRSVLESVADLEVEGLHPIEKTFEEDGHLCVVRPFVPGSTLAARVKVEGPLEPMQVLDLGRRLCSILAAVHGEGLAHGDVRPGHVLLPEDTDADEAVLLDLGSPSPPGANTAPELHQGRAAIPASDVYGLCMTLYVALVGRSPFRADATQELSWIVRSSPPPPLRVMRDVEVDQVLERIIMWGLSKDPASRPTVSEVATVLAAVAAEDKKKADEILAKAPRPGQKGRKAPPGDSMPPEALTKADETSPTLRMVRKLLPKSVLKSTGLTQGFFVEGEAMERELAELEREEAAAARENTLAWVRAIALLLIGVSLAALAVWGLTR